MASEHAVLDTVDTVLHGRVLSHVRRLREEGKTYAEVRAELRTVYGIDVVERSIVRFLERNKEGSDG